MIESATGLILRTRPLTETSLIVQWLAPNLGRVATVAKGARRAKSPFAGKLDVFYLADFSFSRSRASELHTLREVGLRETHPELRQNLDYVRQAAYAAALIEQVTETETPLPAVFELLAGFLRHLPEQPPRAQTVFAFELKLLTELGLAPDLEQTNLTAGSKRVVRTLLESDWPFMNRLKLTGDQMTEVPRFLRGYLIYHLGKFPPGRAAASAGEHRL